ncbi:hypothetical protein [Corynebacterium massiliense]|uniref:hypothetical protein n=1 Tax=Corynebacterium massiliense TaxID=441501 RepID=UPI0012EC5806|nr:hypothetical protein [Corynebacterium massiliense]
MNIKTVVDRIIDLAKTTIPLRACRLSGVNLIFISILEINAIVANVHRRFTPSRLGVDMQPFTFHVVVKHPRWYTNSLSTDIYVETAYPWSPLARSRAGPSGT